MIEHNVELLNDVENFNGVLLLTFDYGEDAPYTFRTVELTYLNQDQQWRLDYDDSWPGFQEQEAIKLLLTDAEITQILITESPLPALLKSTEELAELVERYQAHFLE